jgi:hypothetical protein
MRVFMWRVLPCAGIVDISASLAVDPNIAVDPNTGAMLEEFFPLWLSSLDQLSVV